MMNKIIVGVKGFCMGTADVIPGVSGGTMAFILGIYEQLLAAIKSFDNIWLKQVVTLQIKPAVQRPHLGFLIPLLIGIGCAVLFFTRVIPLPQLLHSHPEVVYGLFFGLIIGSIVVLLPETGKRDSTSFLLLAVGTLLGYLVVTLVPMNTPDALWFIFLSGMLAISAMLLPGISGSFILLILNKYDTVLNAIGHFNFAVLIPFGLGALTGLVVFSRVLSWLLARFHRQMLLIIIGILIGSLWKIWPFQVRLYQMIHGKEKLIGSEPVFPKCWSEQVSYALVMMFLGFVIVLMIHRLAKYKNQD